MKYIFFDTECANCFNRVGKICEFGYVKTDTDFNILDSQNYFINPKPDGKFHLTGRKNQKDLILTEKQEFYYNQPKFSHFYDNIRFLLTQPDIMIFGHSVRNDIFFLDSDIRRFNLKTFPYTAYDTQSFLEYFSKTRKKNYSLETAYKELVFKELPLQAHKAVNDAMFTMEVTKAMLKDLSVTMDDLIYLCPDSKIEAEQYLKEAKAKAEFKKGPNGKGRYEYFNAACDEATKLISDESQKSHRYTLSGHLKDDLEKQKAATDMILSRGFLPVRDTKNAEIMIVLDAEDEAFIRQKMKDPITFAFINYDDFTKDKGSL
jgi:DNA polymerase III epsilon subunit-like protein